MKLIVILLTQFVILTLFVSQVLLPTFMPNKYKLFWLFRGPDKEDIEEANTDINELKKETDNTLKQYQKTKQKVDKTVKTVNQIKQKFN